MRFHRITLLRFLTSRLPWCYLKAVFVLLEKNRTLDCSRTSNCVPNCETLPCANRHTYSVICCTCMLSSAYLNSCSICTFCCDWPCPVRIAHLCKNPIPASVIDSIRILLTSFLNLLGSNSAVNGALFSCISCHACSFTYLRCLYHHQHTHRERRDDVR